MALRDSRGRFVKVGDSGGGVQVIDRGWESLTARMRALKGKGKFVAIGVQGDEASESRGDLTNAQLATYHEFGGDPGPPERSFIRSTFDEKQDEIKGRVDKLGKDFFTPGPVDEPEDSLLLIGEQFAGAIKQKMKAGIPAKESGEVAFLIDTGQLWNSITAAFVDPEAVR